MRICIINTGGTISSTGQPLAPMAADRFARAAQDLLGPALAAALPGDALHFDTGLRFSDDGPGTLDSTDLRPSDWRTVLRPPAPARGRDLLRRTPAARVLRTQGVDDTLRGL